MMTRKRAREVLEELDVPLLTKAEPQVEAPLIPKDARVWVHSFQIGDISFNWRRVPPTHFLEEPSGWITWTGVVRAVEIEPALCAWVAFGEDCLHRGSIPVLIFPLRLFVPEGYKLELSCPRITRLPQMSFGSSPFPPALGSLLPSRATLTPQLTRQAETQPSTATQLTAATPQPTPVIAMQQPMVATAMQQPMVATAMQQPMLATATMQQPLSVTATSLSHDDGDPFPYQDVVTAIGDSLNDEDWRRMALECQRRGLLPSPPAQPSTSLAPANTTGTHELVMALHEANKDIPMAPLCPGLKFPLGISVTDKAYYPHMWLRQGADWRIAMASLTTKYAVQSRISSPSVLSRFDMSISNIAVLLDATGVRQQKDDWACVYLPFFDVLRDMVEYANIGSAEKASRVASALSTAWYSCEGRLAIANIVSREFYCSTQAVVPRVGAQQAPLPTVTNPRFQKIENALENLRNTRYYQQRSTTTNNNNNNRGRGSR